MTGGPAIMLVEDNPDDEDLTLRALKRASVLNPVTVAHDGAEALEYLFPAGSADDAADVPLPGLILLDLKLPKVSGLEVLKSVKSDPRTQAVPVVVMTSSREQRDMVEGYRLGVNSYIQKPIDFNQFQTIIRDLGYYWLVVNQSPPPEAFPAWKT